LSVCSSLVKNAFHFALSSAWCNHFCLPPNKRGWSDQHNVKDN
jgi:hypothetical protein